MAAINSYSTQTQSISSPSASEESHSPAAVEQRNITEAPKATSNQEQKVTPLAQNDADKCSEIFDNVFFNDFDFNAFGSFEGSVFF